MKAIFKISVKEKLLPFLMQVEKNSSLVTCPEHAVTAFRHLVGDTGKSFHPGQTSTVSDYPQLPPEGWARGTEKGSHLNKMLMYREK